MAGNEDNPQWKVDHGKPIIYRRVSVGDREGGY